MSGLSRRALLASAAGLGAAGVLGLPARAAEARHLFVIVANGAWDPTFHLDPKPGRVDGPYPDVDPEDPEDVEEELAFGEVRVAANARRRSGVARLFEAYGPRITVVNGLWAGTLSHWTAMGRLVTGTTDPDAPDLVALAGARAGADRPLPALDGAGVGRPGTHSATTGRTGVRGQLAALLSPEGRYPLPDGRDRPDPRLDEADRRALARFHAARHPRSARDEALRRAARLHEAADDIVPLVATGRRRALRDDLLLAVELVAAGVCHSAMIDSAQFWDSHSEAARQHASTDAVFHGTRLLAEALEERGLLDDSRILLVSEMGRTPRRNAQDGTDHWPYTSALVLGADRGEARRLGGTGDDLVGLPADRVTGRVQRTGDPLTFPDLVAGVLAEIGVEGALPGVPGLRFDG